jgi:serine/threonine protein kinase
MSPEQFEGVISPKTDIWAFGCIILQLITGKSPYHNIPRNESTWGAIRKMICERKISPLEYIFLPKNYQEDFEILSDGNNEVIRNLLTYCF